MVSTKHKFVTGKADGSDTTLVKPSDWNDEHVITTTGDGVYLGRPAGSGPGPIQELSIAGVMFVGTIIIWPSNTIPSGWLTCEGQTLNRVDFPALFALIGGTYGAPDANTFSLPDCRGRVVAHRDAGWTRLSDQTMSNPHLLNGQGGQQQEQQYADVNTSVSTNVSVNISAAGRSYGATSGAQYFGAASDSGYGWSTEIVGGGGYNFGYVAGYHGHNVNGWTQGQALNCYADGTYYGSGSGTGSGSGAGGGWVRLATNVQPTLIMNFIIKCY